MGYLKHCFRLAGNEFDTVFEDGCADVLHRFSGGIPRLANNLVESSLISAVENKLDRVNVAQIKLVASEEYGLDLNQETPAPAAAPVAAPEPAPVVVAEEPVPAIDDDEVPELIQDTLPDLEVLAPALARPVEPTPPAAVPEPIEAPELTLEQTEQGLPTLSTSDEGALANSLEAAQVEATEDEVPAWERDPTLAQLRPDLDALEHAMAVAQGLVPDADGASDAESTPEEIPELVPEITLDRQIQAKVDKASKIARVQEKKRVAAEVAKQAEEKPLIDNRPTAVILAEANARKEKATAKPDNSVESQFEAAALAASLADLQANLNESTDTVTDLPILQDMTTPAFEPAAHREPTAAPQPKPAPEPKPVAVATPEPVPEPEPEPEPEPQPEPQPEPEPEPVAVSEPEPIIEPPPEPEVVISPEDEAKARKADAELEQIAANLAQAKTIDDCDDKMAETLFGEEFSMMAAAVAANAPPELSANDDTEEVGLEVEIEAEVEEEVEEEPPVSFDESAGIPELNVELQTMPNGVTGHVDLSASQRLATVRALNAAPSAHAPEPVAMPTASVEPPPAFDHPESIEDQINTSMTQTLAALNVRPPEIHDDDDDDKGGFFSRFKR
jgi:hypothetical protein